MFTTVLTPDNPMGITKSISLGEFPTKYKPAAAPSTDTETPFSSTGRNGRRFISDPVVGPVFAGARAAVEVIRLNSPAASPTAVPGVGLGLALGLGLGLGLGDGDGLALGLGLGLGTARALGQVVSVSPAVDSVMTGGERR